MLRFSIRPCPFSVSVYRGGKIPGQFQKPLSELRLILLHRQHILRFSLTDHIGRKCLLRMQSVRRDHPALKIPLAQDFAGEGDLVRLVPDFPLRQHHPKDMVHRAQKVASLLLRRPRSPQGLSVDRHRTPVRQML